MAAVSSSLVASSTTTALLQSLVPYTVEPAVLVTTYENEAGELIVPGPRAESKGPSAGIAWTDRVLLDVTPGGPGEAHEKLQTLDWWTIRSQP